MKINSEKLYEFINDLGTNEKVRFKVYNDDVYETEILWNGKRFEWEHGTFSTEAFFNPLYDFEEIEEEKEIKKTNLRYVVCKSDFSDLRIVDILNNFFKANDVKINELIDEINKLKKVD